ncbi:diguanylate cyclase domain-containing protein [Neobacillus sp. LXY-4]|uniref:sensor domain-containing diguanylate cyclase n=1 Tax=Neobacillus sp. LXY-4 TaxID=3379826 RepID=UPI003EE3611C
MEKEKDLVLIHIKSRFLDILDEENSLLHFEQIIGNMTRIIADTIRVNEVCFFYCSDWKERLMVDGVNIDDTDLVRPAVSCSEFAEGVEQGSASTLLVCNDGETFGFLAIYGTDFDARNSFLLEEIGREAGCFLKKAQNLSKIAVREKKYRLLFRVTEKFHSTMDMDGVLEEIIAVLQEVYPAFHYSLYLSQDNHSNSHLPIKGLHYDSENMAAMEAYVTGIVQTEDSINENRSNLYAPLKGKQGVYGVLQITASNTLIFPKKEVEFISLLANTAGNALENAQLYQQSKRLISDLKLINQVSHHLNSKQRFSDTVTYMCDQIIKSFDAEEVGFILYKESRKKAKILEGSTRFFFTNKAEIYIQYFQEQLLREKGAVFIGDFNLLNDRQFRSIMAVPMIQTGVIEGFILVMHKQPYHFSFESYKLLRSLIYHSTLAFVNSTLREELERMVITDYLTKLFTRNYLDQQIQLSMRDDSQGTFILIDIDNFKGINDTYGHQVGDDILIQVANVMRGNIRDSDVAARWGGEELAIYLPKVSIERGSMIATRIVERVMEGTSPSVTVSCGVSHWTKRKKDSVQQLFNRADQALYLAKTSGKNKVVTQKELKR